MGGHFNPPNFRLTRGNMGVLQKKYTDGSEFFPDRINSSFTKMNDPKLTGEKSELNTFEQENQSMYPSVTIIIPTYNDWNGLAVCLDALNDQSYPKKAYDIIVVNNNPENSLPSGFEHAENVSFIHESKVGSYAARNTGLKLAKGQIIGFTDADCTPAKTWIKNAVDFLLEHENITRVAGPVAITLKSAKPTVIEKYNQLYSFPQEWLIGNTGGSVTANLFVRKSVFESVGGFDETVLSMGDKLWGMKAQAAGFPIAFVENVVVFHPARNLKELISKEKRHGGAISHTLPAHPFKIYLRFFYECRPRLSGLTFMFGRRKDLRLIDRITIPFLRHFLIMVRIYESIKIRLGKKNPARA